MAKKGSKNTLVASGNEFREIGIKIPAGSATDERGYDILERYKAVKNHAIFLFTSEDNTVEDHIRSHWGALDGLSGEFCDIHTSFAQMTGEEDFYSQIEDIKSLPGLSNVAPTDLPALHIWSAHAFLLIDLKPYRFADQLVDVLRFAFSRIREINDALSKSDFSVLAQDLKVSFLPETNSQSVSNTMVNGSIYQIANHFYFGEREMSETANDKTRSKQKVSKVELTGSIVQQTDASDADQEVDDAKAVDLKQAAQSEKERLSFGKHSASGRWAIVGLVVLVIVVAVIQLF